MSNHDDERKQKRRKPPPAAFRYVPGFSGNLRGRPKGSISLKALTRKVALKRHSLLIDGRQQSLSWLELVIATVLNMAMTGDIGAKKTVKWLNEKRRPDIDESPGGFLLLPERWNDREAEAMIAALNENHPYEPGSPEWHQWKRRPVVTPPPVDPDSPLGIALQEFKHKWRADAPEPGVISITDRLRQANDRA